jgi:hypothetical protein
LTSPQRKIVEDVAGTRWTLREAIFSRASKRVMADIEVGMYGCISRIWVDDVALVAPMAQAGYAMRDQSGERPLRVGEVVVERVLLERAVARPATIHAWPTRRAREIPRVKRRLVDTATVRRMRESAWEWTVTEVARDGAPSFADARAWRAHAWCLVTEEDGIELGIRLVWRKKPAGPEMRDARRRCAAVLGSFGYVSANVRGEIVLEKSVKSVAEARVERERIDDLLV